MSKLKKITGYLTPDQVSAFKQAQSVYNAQHDKQSQASIIDMLIEQFCEQHGVEYPQDKNPHGYRKDYKDFSESE